MPTDPLSPAATRSGVSSSGRVGPSVGRVGEDDDRAERELLVVSAVRERKIPVAMVLSGMKRLTGSIPWSAVITKRVWFRIPAFL